MDRRILLDDILKEICPNVYYQPPESVKMKYPCIVYRRSNGKSEYADNKPYSFVKTYMITIIDKNPDSEYIDKVAALPSAAYDRHYTYENLNHDVFVVNEASLKEEIYNA